MARNTEGGPDDNRGMNPRRRSWNDRQVEALLRGRERTPLADVPLTDTDLLSVLADLRAFATTATPPPSVELAAILDGSAAVPASGQTATLPRQANPLRNRIGAAVVLVTASLSLTTVATAANALPTGAQRAAATVLNTVTPFHFPKPHHAPPVHTPDPALFPSPDPSPSQEPADGDEGSTSRPEPTAGPGSEGEQTAAPSPQEEPTSVGEPDSETGGTTSHEGTSPSPDSHETNPSATPEAPDSNSDQYTGQAGTRPSPTPTTPSEDQADPSSD
jgi:hypothetical protein